MDVLGRNVFAFWCCLLGAISSLCLAKHTHGPNSNGCTRSGLLRKEMTRMLQNTCYYFEERPTTHKDAQRFCQNLGGSLVMLKSRAINNFIFREIRQTFKMRHGVNHFWIGLSDQGREDVYKWSDGSPMTWDNFGIFQGTKAAWTHYLQDCAVIDGKTGKWRDYPCRGKWLSPPIRRPYICQYGPTRIIYPIEPEKKIISIVRFGDNQ